MREDAISCIDTFHKGLNTHTQHKHTHTHTHTHTQHTHTHTHTQTHTHTHILSLSLSQTHKTNTRQTQIYTVYKLYAYTATRPPMCTHKLKGIHTQTLSTYPPPVWHISQHTHTHTHTLLHPP